VAVKFLKLPSCWSESKFCQCSVRNRCRPHSGRAWTSDLLVYVIVDRGGLTELAIPYPTELSMWALASPGNTRPSEKVLAVICQIQTDSDQHQASMPCYRPRRLWPDDRHVSPQLCGGNCNPILLQPAEADQIMLDLNDVQSTLHGLAIGPT
jgi:hypothetical protein